MQITKGKVFKYTVLPGFIPRIRNLVTSGFGNIAFLMAMIYQAVRLLPPDHAYLNPRNVGRFGIRHVMTEASRNLKFTKKNIDQIIIYFTILTGLILLLGQTVLFIIAVIAQQPAVAQTLISLKDLMSVNSIYNAGPSQDLVFMMLDRVFGVVGIFNSCVSTAAACVDLNGNPLSEPPVYPTPFHTALHTMLRFYSLGIFIVSVFIILYFVVTLAAETAATGSPFGGRMNTTWMPVRLILFFALLVPLNIGGVNAGLNAAQLITFWTAKFGSNFASNAWGRFNFVLTTSYLGDTQQLVAIPNTPEMGELVKFMFVAKTCKIAEEWDGKNKDKGNIQAYLVRDSLSRGLYPGPDRIELTTTNYETARKFSNYGNITLRFGLKGEPGDRGFADFRGNVDPVCGELKLPILSAERGATLTSGAAKMQELYYGIAQDMWKGSLYGINKRAECLVRYQPFADDEACSPMPDKDFANNVVQGFQNRLNAALPAMIRAQYMSGEWNVPVQLKQKGWGGAAIWYNRIAQLNGDIAASIYNVPQPTAYPIVLEAIAEQRTANNDSVNAANIFDPDLADGKEPKYPRNQVRDKALAIPMYAAYKFWVDGGYATSEEKKTKGNFIIDAINVVIGTNGVFEMRKNKEIHPLAQLSSVGRSMMEASLRNIGLGVLGEGTSMLFSGTTRKYINMAGSMVSTIGFSFIAISFILFYVLPFMPFIYFFFAASNWVKAIFEAIVAMPLWALAHIRIEGEGLPGPGAEMGYFLLLEIFLRPIMIVFGLILSIGIFSSMVFVLNDTFDLIVANVSGFDQSLEATAGGSGTGAIASMVTYARSTIDEFFFTILYAVLCYMIGLSSFKMIDAIPDSIMRWLNDGVKPFSSGDGNEADDVLNKVYSGTEVISGKAQGGALAVLTGGK